MLWLITWPTSSFQHSFSWLQALHTIRMHVGVMWKWAGTSLDLGVLCNCCRRPEQPSGRVLHVTTHHAHSISFPYYNASTSFPVAHSSQSGCLQFNAAPRVVHDALPAINLGTVWRVAAALLDTVPVFWGRCAAPLRLRTLVPFPSLHWLEARLFPDHRQPHYLLHRHRWPTLHAADVRQRVHPVAESHRLHGCCHGPHVHAGALSLLLHDSCHDSLLRSDQHHDALLPGPLCIRLRRPTYTWLCSYTHMNEHCTFIRSQGLAGLC